MADMRRLVAQPRDQDLKPRAMRRAGLIPGVLYGFSFETRALQFEEHNLQQVIRAGGTTRLLDLKIADEAEQEIVLVREIQRDSVTGRLLHIDLYRTIAGQAITATVPLITVGEAPATEEGGVVNQLLDSLDIECLPKDLPDEIIVDLSPLTELDSAILISDLDIPEGVTVLHDHASAVARIVIPRAAVEEEEELEAEELVEGEELEEGEEPAEAAADEEAEE
jgi:large subunit ribosomal protein L25